MNSQMALSSLPTPSGLNLEGVREELESHIKTRSDGLSSTWGFFPELMAIQDLRGYVECLKLSSRLSKVFRTMELAFIRLATGEPVSSFQGLHIDVHPGVGHKYPRGVPVRPIQRLLVNLGSVPRRLQYCPLSLAELREWYGVSLSRVKHEAIRPRGLPLLNIDIPPLDSRMYYLSFESSSVLHSGVTDERGHFMASYGRLG